MAYKIIHSDYCPETNDNVTMSITVAEVKSIGMHGFKKISFSCPQNANGECLTAGSNGKSCPVYNNFTPKV